MKSRILKSKFSLSRTVAYSQQKTKPTKHLFFIHSSICLIISEHIIASNKISEDDVILILSRGFQYPNNKTIKTISTEEILKYRIRLRWNIIRSAIECKKLDNKINALTGKSAFYTYTPQTAIPFVELLITHKKCIGFYYIEEGHSSYEPSSTINQICPIPKRLSDLIKKLGWLNRIKNHDFFELENCINSFCTDKNAFPDTDKKIIFNKIFTNKKQITTSKIPAKHKLYCAFDAISVHNNAFKTPHILAFIIAVRHYITKNNASELIIKYHPDQIISEEFLFFEKTIKNELSNITTLRFLPKDFNLELELSKEVYADILVLSSSIGMYGQRMGHDVYTFFPVFKKLVPEYLHENIFFNLAAKISKEFNSIYII